MEITVKKKYIRMSPRKIRPVLFGLRGQNAEDALNQMRFTQKEAAGFMVDILRSGIGAAKENDLKATEVFIKSVLCNEGPRLKRRRFWSKGQSRRITKKMSHLVLTLTNNTVAEEVKPEKKEIKDKAEKTSKKQDTITNQE